MPSGRKRTYNDIAYFRKDHFCPQCGTKLNKASVSKVVNSRSPEAKDFDFEMSGGGYLVGDVEFTWDEFECSSCNKRFSVSEVKESEGIAAPKKAGTKRKILSYIVSLLIILLLMFLKAKNIF